MKVPQKAECQDNVRLLEGRSCQHLEAEEIRRGAGADKFLVGRGSEQWEGVLGFLLKLEMRLFAKTESGGIKLQGAGKLISVQYKEGLFRGRECWHSGDDGRQR